jgi:uncharacterized protein (DUF983 family)
MVLVECSRCNEWIVATEDKCPKCGFDRKRARTRNTILAVLGFWVLGFLSCYFFMLYELHFHPETFAD